MASAQETEERLRAALTDRYRIHREIGEGGMATVYLATDLRHERNVALKVLRPDLAASLGAERFLQEVRVTANLQHPHILPLFDSGEADGFLFYVMPFIEGESLRERLVRERELPVSEVARLLRDVVDALAAAHHLGVVHRDIKPENVLISGRHALVADFGVAKAVGEATGRHKLTTLGVALGTPSYMAPEQAAADEAIDSRTDIYAVGVMAYELLAGRPPFSGRTPQQILAAQVMETPQPISELRASVPPALEAFIMRCLEKKPADRWQTAEEMLPHLEAAATPSGGITPTDIHPVTRPSPLTRRRLPALIAVVATVVVMTAGYFGLFWKRGPDLVETRVAVIPFENRTGDEGMEALGSLAADRISDGISRSELIGELLAPVPAQSVQSVARARRENPAPASGRGPVASVAEATGAGTIVSGWYYFEGEALLFHAEITAAGTGEVLESVQLREPGGGRTEALRALEERVTGALAVHFLADQEEWTEMSFQASPKHSALVAFKTGEDLYFSSAAEALHYFDRAYELDSTFVEAPLRSVVAHMQFSMPAADSALRRFISEHPRDELSLENQLWVDLRNAQIRGDLRGQLEVSRRQLAVDPDNKRYRYGVGIYALRLNRPSEAIEHLSPLTLTPWGRERDAVWRHLTASQHILGDHDEELSVARRGREALPANTSTLLYEAQALAALGRVQEVNRLLDESLMFSNGSPGEVMLTVSLELRAHGHPGEARVVLNRALDWYGTRPPSETAAEDHRSNLARALYSAERWPEAQALFEELAGEFPGNLDYLGHLGALAARRENTEEAARVSEALAGLGETDLSRASGFRRACIAALLGDKDRAVTLLREAQRQGFWRIHELHREIDLEGLRGHPAFEEFMRPKG